MSDWEQADSGGRLGRRGRAVVVVLLLVGAGAWLAAPTLSPGSEDDRLEVGSNGDDAEASDTRPGDPSAGNPADDPEADREPTTGEAEPQGGPGPSPAEEPQAWMSLLLTDDSQFTAVDLATGHRERTRLPELSGGDPPFRLTRRGDAVVFYGRGGDTYAAHPAALDEPWLIGRSSYYLPSAHPYRVWLVEGRMNPGADNRVREVTVDGEVIVDWTGLPPGTVPLAAVDSGIVLSTGEGLRVWDPRSGDDVAEIDGMHLAGTTGDLVAWCDRGCGRLRVTEAASGEEASLEAPMQGSWAPHRASFSPDGDLLAAQVSLHLAERPGSREETGLALVRVRGGQATLEEAFSADLELAGAPVWSRYGDQLLAAVRGGDVLLHHRTTGDSGSWGSLPADLPTHYGMVGFEDGAVLGGFGGDRPLGPRRVGDLVVSLPDLEDKTVRAVDPAAGEVRWTREFDDYTFLGPPAGDTVLVSSGSDVVALDLASGEERWALGFQGSAHPGTPTVADGVAYVPTSFGVHDDAAPRLHAVDIDTGQVRWSSSTQVAGTDLQWAPPLLTDSHVLVADTASYEGSGGRAGLRGFDRETGELVLSRPLDDGPGPVGGSGFHLEPLVLDGDHVLVTGGPRSLQRIDWRTGELAWSQSFDTLPRHLEVTEDAVEFRVHTREVRLDRLTGKPLDP